VGCALGGGGRRLTSGARIDFIWDIFILNEIWMQGKIYILRGTLRG
jgi:hypothetical protein